MMADAERCWEYSWSRMTPEYFRLNQEVPCPVHIMDRVDVRS